jgi:hypothetical protein
MSEFDGIFEPTPERPVMRRPPKMIASKSFIREVRDMLDEADGDETKVADWIADKMERFGARTAQPIFDMKGNGPGCSWCGTVWPLCGHHHQSEELNEDEAGDDE